MKKMLTNLKITIVLGLVLLFSGCTGTTVYRTNTVVPTISDNVYTSCPLPTTVKDDLGVSSSGEIHALRDNLVDKKLLAAYGNTKADHIACYKTLVNVKTAYSELKLQLEKGNGDNK